MDVRTKNSSIQTAEPTPTTVAADSRTLTVKSDTTTNNRNGYKATPNGTGHGMAQLNVTFTVWVPVATNVTATIEVPKDRLGDFNAIKNAFREQCDEGNAEVEFNVYGDDVEDHYTLQGCAENELLDDHESMIFTIQGSQGEYRANLRNSHILDPQGKDLTKRLQMEVCR